MEKLKKLLNLEIHGPKNLTQALGAIMIQDGMITSRNNWEAMSCKMMDCFGFL